MPVQLAGIHPLTHPLTLDCLRLTLSGTNLAVVLAAALVVCGWLRIGLRWRPPVALLTLLAFVVLARPSPSVLRAAVVGVTALVALATGSRRQAMPALCGAVLALVLLSPELASQRRRTTATREGWAPGRLPR
jgi:hypothetical protein